MASPNALPQPALLPSLAFNQMSMPTLPVSNTGFPKAHSSFNQQVVSVDLSVIPDNAD